MPPPRRSHSTPQPASTKAAPAGHTDSSHGLQRQQQQHLLSVPCRPAAPAAGGSPRSAAPPNRGRMQEKMQRPTPARASIAKLPAGNLEAGTPALAGAPDTQLIARHAHAAAAAVCGPILKGTVLHPASAVVGTHPSGHTAVPGISQVMPARKQRASVHAHAALHACLLLCHKRVGLH